MRRPLAGARVTLAGLTNSPLRTAGLHPQRYEVHSAMNGTFSFTAVAQGKYMLAARLSGYAPGRLGEDYPGEPMQFLDVGAGDDVNGLELRLWPAGVISGVVRSTSGTPMFGRLVQAMATAEPRSWDPVVIAHQPPSLTTSTGAYRLENVTPGSYLVASSDGTAFPPLEPFPARLNPSVVFYPDAPSPVGARLVNVAPGEEVRNVDVVVPERPLRCCQVSGRVEGASSDVSGQWVRLVTANGASGLPPLELLATALQSDGSFLFPYAPPGVYEIRGLLIPGYVPTSRPGGLLLGSGRPQVEIESSQHSRVRWFRQSVTVRDGEALSPVIMTAQEGSRVRGRLVPSPDVVGIDLSETPIVTRSLDGWNLDGLRLGRTERDGRFSSPALPPGRYLLTPRSTGNALFVDEAVLRGQDVIGVGVEVGYADIDGLVMTITSAKTIVTGVVRDQSGKNRPDARVIYFRTQGAWQQGIVGPPDGPDVGSERTDRVGSYAVTLAPGAYYVTAVAGRLPAHWRTATFLQALIPQSMSVSPGRGMRVTANLTVQPMPK